MIKTKKASHSGFCFGVKRAISIAEDCLENKKPLYSLGPIIHNPIVVKGLDKKGLKVISDIDKAKDSYILIRSHGISPSLRKKAMEFSLGLVDATCPFVKRSQDIVTSLKKEGYKIIIVGEKNHPEIRALSDIGGSDCIVIKKDSDLKGFNLKNKRAAILAQTTLSRENFLNLACSLLGSGCFEYRIFDTICNDVVKRQTEAKVLARMSDVVLVVGGKISANTRHLAEICRAQGAKTYCIETEKEIRPAWFKSAAQIAVVSGASTPEEIVDSVISKLKKFNPDKGGRIKC
jgi:4-hydroxy-3-methylbut-2-enyl diphosphate reductase